MRYIKTFNEDQICEQIIEYIESSINEDIKSMWDKTLSKIKNLSNQSKRKILLHLIGSMLTLSAADNVYDIISSSSSDTKEIALDVLKDVKKDKFKSGQLFSISKEGKDSIKEHEKLRLTAYNIGDGKISIGWGHAEDPSTSKYKIGEIISKEEADEIFNKDLKVIENGVKRIFKEWDRKKLGVKITQPMYDALISIAYNTGVGGLRKAEALQHLKKKDYINAGKSIKNFKVSKEFPGLATRRAKESEMFLSGV